ncbi:hypothetical protein HYR99_11030 [Candidatus Poribacteria bacterium]|nr:hypothetical protein [Candidatus Poribacteria bacterium]
MASGVKREQNTDEQNERIDTHPFIPSIRAITPDHLNGYLKASTRSTRRISLPPEGAGQADRSGG